MNEVVQIDANIDNMNPEYYDRCMELCLEAGALDVWYTPIIMKKGRPAIMLSVLCEERDTVKLSELIITHTTTLGVRYASKERVICERMFREISVNGHTIHVKEGYYEGKLLHQSLEYEDVKAYAMDWDISLEEATREIWETYYRKNSMQEQTIYV